MEFSTPLILLSQYRGTFYVSPFVLLAKIKYIIQTSLIMYFDSQYREWDLNPHSHRWPKDFKSFVSTYSTIAAVEIFSKSAAKVLLFFDMCKLFAIFYIRRRKIEFFVFGKG